MLYNFFSASYVHLYFVIHPIILHSTIYTFTPDYPSLYSCSLIFSVLIRITFSIASLWISWFVQFTFPKSSFLQLRHLSAYLSILYFTTLRLPYSFLFLNSSSHQTIYTIIIPLIPPLCNGYFSRSASSYFILNFNFYCPKLLSPDIPYFLVFQDKSTYFLIP